MNRVRLGAAWVVLAILLVAASVWGVNTWRSLATRGREAASARTRLTASVKAKQEEVLREMRSQGLLREMQWTVERTDPSVFLNGLAELARGTRLKIMAIGPLERRATPQFVKSWQTVQVIAPFRDFRELAIRIEREKGLLEDLVVELPKEVPRPTPGAPASGESEIQARFKMTSLEVTGEAKRVLQRALAAGGGAPAVRKASEPTVAPVAPQKPIELAGRDPFAFAETAVAAVPAKPQPPPPAPPPAPVARAAPPDGAAKAVAMDVKGIVSMPDGYLAIVNNEIIKTGDLVENHRVERITATTVVLRQPDGEQRSLTLPSITTISREAPRR